MRAEADAGVGAEVAEDLPLGQLAVHGRELGHVDGDGAAAPLSAARAADLEAGGVGEVDQQLRSAASEFSRIRSTPTSSIRS